MYHTDNAEDNDKDNDMDYDSDKHKDIYKDNARTIDQISAKFTPCLIELDGLHHRNGNKSQEKHETSLASTDSFLRL